MLTKQKKKKKDKKAGKRDEEFIIKTILYTSLFSKKLYNL